MSYQTICVPVALQRYVGFTPIALRQRELAMALARQFDAEVMVLSVDAPITLLPHLQSTEAKLEQYAEPLRDEGIRHQTHFREGKPSREIRELTEELGADLIIIGSHSKRGPLVVSLGSTALALSRKTSVPVLMLWPTPDEVERTRELLIPHYPFVFPYG